MIRDPNLVLFPPLNYGENIKCGIGADLVLEMKNREGAYCEYEPMIFSCVVFVEVDLSSTDSEPGLV